MSKSEVKLVKNQGNLNISISGIIDEDLDFSKYPLAGVESIEIDVNGLKSLNSCGIRDWIKWIHVPENIKVSIKNCPKVLIDQINMVDSFLPVQAKVVSFYVPYYCESDNTSTNVLFSLGVDYSAAENKIPETLRNSRGEEMELDVVPDKYFRFFKKHV